MYTAKSEQKEQQSIEIGRHQLRERTVLKTIIVKTKSPGTDVMSPHWKSSYVKNVKNDCYRAFKIAFQ